MYFCLDRTHKIPMDLMYMNPNHHSILDSIDSFIQDQGEKGYIYNAIISPSHATLWKINFSSPTSGLFFFLPFLRGKKVSLASFLVEINGLCTSRLSYLSRASYEPNYTSCNHKYCIAILLFDKEMRLEELR